MDVGETGAEEIPTDDEIRDASLANGGLRIDAVGLARFVIARVASAGDVQKMGRYRGRE